MIVRPGTALVVIVAKREPKKTIREMVFARVKRDACIHHEIERLPASDSEGWCDRKSSKMGLCTKHYGEYRNEIANRDPQVVAEIESEMIHEGLLLSRQLVREIKRDSPMRKITNRVVEK